MTKKEVAAKLAEMTGQSAKSIWSILDAISGLLNFQLDSTGEFTLPGVAKFKVVKTPAKPAREGVNPFTKQPTTFAAKPESTRITAKYVKRPGKKSKEAQEA